MLAQRLVDRKFVRHDVSYTQSLATLYDSDAENDLKEDAVSAAKSEEKKEEEVDGTGHNGGGDGDYDDDDGGGGAGGNAAAHDQHLVFVDDSEVVDPAEEESQGGAGETESSPRQHAKRIVSEEACDAARFNLVRPIVQSRLPHPHLRERTRTRTDISSLIHARSFFLFVPFVSAPCGLTR